MTKSMHRRIMVGGVAGLAIGLRARFRDGAAHEATPFPDALPVATARFSLSDMDLPKTWEEVEDHFHRLPREVHGMSRNPLQAVGPDRIRVTYGLEDHPLGAPLVLQALDFRQGDFFPPDFTPGMYVAMASQSDDVGATAYGHEHGIAWIQAESHAATADGTPTVDRPLYTFAWGATNSPILFTAASTTNEGLAALVEAFVLAGEQSG